MSSMPARPERIRIGVCDLADAQRLEDLVAAHVGQVEVEKDDVVVVELAKIDAFLAEVGRVDVETFGLQHQLDALRRCAVVLDQKDPHVVPLFPDPFSRSAARMLEETTAGLRLSHC